MEVHNHSWSSHKPMSIESVIPSSHLIHESFARIKQANPTTKYIAMKLQNTRDSLKSNQKGKTEDQESDWEQMSLYKRNQKTD